MHNSRLTAGLFMALTNPAIPLSRGLEESEVRPMLETYCFKCHGGGKEKGGIELEDFRDSVDVWRDRTVWMRIRDAIRAGAMPPEEARELPEAARASLSAWISHTLDNVDIDRLPLDPGHVPPRRLNRTEFRYTIADLFGIKSGAWSMLPGDQVSNGGFDNEAPPLATQPLLIEKYLQTADVIIDEVWKDRAAVERLIFEAPMVAPVAAGGPLPWISSEQQSATLSMGDGSFAIVVRFKTDRAGGALVAKAPERDEWVPGAKTFFVTGSGELAYDIGWLGQKRSGQKVNDGRWHTAVLRQNGTTTSALVDGEPAFAAEGMSRPDVPGHRFKIGAAGGEFTAFRGEISRVRCYKPGVSDDAALTLSKGGDIPEKPVFVRESPDKPVAQPPEFNEPEAARRVLTGFLSQAFRRAPTDEELARYGALFQKARTQGDDYHTAMKLPVRTALMSPTFLFRPELAQPGTGAHRISSPELACRLSYFLWSSLPDDRLAKLAAEGKLDDATVLDSEVTRMLRDPRAQRMSRHFGSQWLRIDGLGHTIRPDKEKFPGADAELLEAMKEESVLFIHAIFADDLPLRTLLNADFTFANQRLAEHYGIPGVTGSGMRRIALTGSGTDRGGVLTQASVLTVTSSPRRSSPVFRGKWILDVLLGQPPPPPPPNIPSLEASAERNPASLREALTAHRADAACVGCHNRIDPLGFALEAFDATGKLREGPVDNAGRLPDGSSFAGHTGLKELLENKMEGEFIRHFASRLLVYALGRELTFNDERALQIILKDAARNGFSSQSLVRAIVSSYPFQYSKQPGAEDPSR